MRTVLAILLSAALASGVGSAAAQQQYVMLGAIQALSGPNAPYGAAIRNGLELAVAEINAAGGVLRGRQLRLIFEDSAGEPARAVLGARRLIDSYRVPLIIGPTLSIGTFAVGPLAVERRVPLVSSSATALGVTDIGPYVFRTALPASRVIPVLLEKARQHYGIKSAGILYGIDDAFTSSEYQVFRTHLESLGIEILATETFRHGDDDFSGQLTRIAERKPDAVVISALIEPAAAILMQARELNIPPSTVFIGGDGFNSPKLGEDAGAAADGVLVGSPWFLGRADPANQRFVEAYRAKYGQDPDQFAAQAYDTAHIIAAAIDLAGDTNGDNIRAGLMQTHHDGVLGPFWFSPRRDPGTAEGAVVLIMRDGAFAILE